MESSSTPVLQAEILAQWGDVLDARALTALIELDPVGKLGLVAKVLRVFTTSLPKYVVQMEVARLNIDAKLAGLAAHTVKSSAANIGALKLARLSAEAERLCANGSAWAGAPALDEFLAECRRFQALALPRLTLN